MSPSYSYSELQKKFCEGFVFYPFKELEQYGSFIYKNYAPSDGTPRILDLHSRSFDPGSLHAQVLLLKLQQRDIPIAAELLYKLQSTGYGLEKRFNALKRCPVVNMQLLDTMETYHRILAVYQHHVQQHIAAELAAMPGTRDNKSYEDVSTDNIRQIQAIAEEFLRSTDIICSFLEGCLDKLPGFRKLQLLKNEEEALQDLLKTIGVFRELQLKTIQVLDEWKQQAIHVKDQQTLN
ncbi:hypothetical protein [Chitinophaga japonensis]|uniref:Uncharacterized protein n=1 Tax=Chitinophaga japonensis TaxID=104662 RepID=A0A562SSM6_CHIJA|nr:hypothetical protein [Chitinophaga japonensis]TWI84108.1 hypothetical protein LX66_4470 [Chitinophaga japonensis]